MIKLPEPAMPASWTRTRSGEWISRETDAYTADQLKQAIRDALEEAAKKCEGIARDDYGMAYLHEYGECAAAIRKLKEDIQ